MSIIWMVLMLNQRSGKMFFDQSRSEFFNPIPSKGIWDAKINCCNILQQSFITSMREEWKLCQKVKVSLSLTHSLSLSLSHLLTCSLSHTHTLSLSLSLTLTDTHTLSLSIFHTLSLSFSLSHTHSHTLSLTHSHTHILSLSLSHTHTLFLSLAYTLSHAYFMLSTERIEKWYWVNAFQLIGTNHVQIKIKREVMF